jgi:hypothetical protein
MSVNPKNDNTNNSYISSEVEGETPPNSIKFIKQLEVKSGRVTRSMSIKQNVDIVELEENFSSQFKFQNDPKRDFALRNRENTKEPDVPFFVTVMGENGKLLFNVCTNRNGDREVQLFFNKGKYNDGLQIVRSCLRNMLSFNFIQIVAINVFRGFYLAVQTNHNNESTQGYNTDSKYKNNIGLLEYIDPQNLQEFADDCKAKINPKLKQYCEEILIYIKMCKDIAKACK